MLEPIKVKIRALKNDVEVPAAARTFENLTEQELLQLERRLNNVMDRMIIFGEKGEKPPGGNERGRLEFEFLAYNGSGFEIAWQGNRWTGIREAEMDFMIGLLAGELEKTDPGIKAKTKFRLKRK
jgi:hypothetical protein